MSEDHSHEDETGKRWEELSPEVQNELRRAAGHFQTQSNQFVWYCYVGVCGGAGSGALVGHLFHSNVAIVVGVILGMLLGYLLGMWLLHATHPENDLF